MLAQDRPKSHGMTTVFKDYEINYNNLIFGNEPVETYLGSNQ